MFSEKLLNKRLSVLSNTVEILGFKRIFLKITEICDVGRSFIMGSIESGKLPKSRKTPLVKPIMVDIREFALP